MSTDLLLAPAANTLVTNLIAVASEQLHFAIGWKGDLKKFCRTIKMLRGVLLDADERNLIGSRSDLKPWIEELRAAADEADDVMEEVAYENLQRRLVVDLKPKWKKVGHFFTLSNPLVFHLRMGNKVKNLNSSLLEISASAAQFGLQTKLATAVPVPLAQPPPADSSPPPQFVGRDEDVLKIESLLVESSSQQDLSVTVIVGMAGLGKTTLVKAVSRSDKIRQKFGENVIWVCVSKSFDPELILKEILVSLSGGDGLNESSQDIVMRKIQQKLDGKNYLLILDDVWNEVRQKWERLRSCLLGISGKGNNVLVTTRSGIVASIMTHSEEEHICRLEKLENDECWSIIKQRVFGSSLLPSEFGELEAVGEEIARKCKGVPLVAILIGATLQSRRSKHEWQSMLENRVWQSYEKEYGIFDIIKFSYDRLPEHALKLCFAFCSIFPEDYVMEKDVLIQLWMAEGFLQPSEESCAVMEDVGDKYFRHLLSYSLFQENERDDLGRVISCTMHDLIHDFAKSLSKSESAVLKEEAEKSISNQTRHLNLISSGEVVPTISRDGAPKLRTLLFSEQDTCDGVQLDSKRLRVLHVSKASDAKELSKCFGKSKSLRYLDISGTEMEEFPKFIKKLYNLQTLRFMYCRSLRMPAEGLRGLINLSHIYFSDERRMPANLGSLTNLQTLKEFYVGKTKGRRIGELGSLSRLRGKLTIYKLELVEGKSEAESARLHEKALDELRLNWSRREDCDANGGVLEGLLPHSSLQRLHIVGFGGMCLPSWMMKSGENRFQFNSLVVLKFESCKRLKSIPAMEGFSSLKELSIRGCEELSDGAFTFQSLKKLSLRNCPNVESFSFSGLTSLEELEIDECGVVNITGDGLSSCTHLRKLKLRGCRELKSIPNLHGLSSLREVNINGCGELACLPSGWSSCTALEVLYIVGCSNLVCVPEELKGLQYSLVKLVICRCPKLSSFPEEMLGCLSKLKSLVIGGFSNDELEEFPGLSSINLLSASLEELTLVGWKRLSEVPSQIQALTALKTLRIEEFDGVEALPEWLGELSSLKSLEIADCSGLRILHNGLPSCTSLEKLSISFCNNLVSVPGDFGLGGLTRLKRLMMGPFSKDLEEFLGLSSIHHLHSSLEELTLNGWEKLTELPQQIQHLTALRKLVIWNFKGMEALPDWLANLPSLQSLEIIRCPKLKTLPSSPEVIKRLSKLNYVFTLNPDWPELKEMIWQEKQSANQSQ